MEAKEKFDVIIVGGSYAGLSAAMALGRSLRRVLILDNGQPCNQQTPHSHNLITHDGQTPHKIAATAREQVLAYDTVKYLHGLAESAAKTATGFEVTTDKGEKFDTRKLLFATGLKDEMPPIPGFAECWGISVLHCPYCHGYEVKHQTIALLGNGDMGYEFCKLISNWSKNLVLFTNGKSTLTAEQQHKLNQKEIKIIEQEISQLVHQQGNLQQVLFRNGSQQKVNAVFARVAFRQHCTIPAQMGCALTDQGLLQVNDFTQTTIPGIFAAGDNTSPFRTLSLAIAAGTKAGAVINKELIEEDFG